MYNFTLRHRNDSDANLLDPESLRQGYFFNTLEQEVASSDHAYSGLMPCSPSTDYQVQGSTGFRVLKAYVFYDINKRFISGDISASYFADGEFSTPSGCYYMVLSVKGIGGGETDPYLISVTPNFGSSYSPYYRTRTINPSYKKLDRKIDQESGYQFYREKIDGNLKLLRSDYDYIDALDFEQEMFLDIEDPEGFFSKYIGVFYKTDCKWDADNKAVELKFDTEDFYTEIIGGLDKTFNLIEEAPELQPITAKRRPIIQVYIPGDKVITNILGGAYWEQEIQVDPVYDNATLVNTYKFFNTQNIRLILSAYASSLSMDITGTYDVTTGERDAGDFKLVQTLTSEKYPGWSTRQYHIVRIGDTLAAGETWDKYSLFKTEETDWQNTNVNALLFSAATRDSFNEAGVVSGNYGTDGVTFAASGTEHTSAFIPVTEGQTFTRVNGITSYKVYAYDENQDPIVVNGSDVFWTTTFESTSIPSGVHFIRVVFPAANLSTFRLDSTETGSFYFTDYKIYTRYYTDYLNVRGTDTYPVPATDIVANNSNYRRIIGYDMGTNQFATYDQFETFSTKFGKVPDDAPNAGEYYKEFLVSVATGLSNPVPVSSSSWKAVSLWFFTDLDIRYTEFIDGMDFELRDTYPLHSVIQTLLTAIGSNVTFNNTTNHSEILYSSTNPLGGFTFLDFNGGTLLSDFSGNLDLFITPKSNILYGDYDQPSNKAEITLGQVLKMLRDTMKLDWFVDSDGRLRIEHISWFQKGGSYSTNQIGTDLTTLVQPRNGKNWGFNQNKWEYAKEDMPERFEYGWMDDVSTAFEGYPIEILSNYVQRGRIEDKTVNGFTSDIDFLTANPQEVTSQGFALLSCVLIDGVYRIPYIEYNLGFNSEVIMQNGFFSWLYLHPKFHVFDLPSDNVKLNNAETSLFNNISKRKKQEVTYPAMGTIDPIKLVRTDLGDGTIDKLTVNMENRIIKATIRHDTE